LVAIRWIQAEKLNRSEDLEEGLLRQVLGQLAIPQQPEGEAVDGFVVTPEERVEGGDVTT